MLFLVDALRRSRWQRASLCCGKLHGLVLKVRWRKGYGSAYRISGLVLAGGQEAFPPICGRFWALFDEAARVDLAMETSVVTSPAGDATTFFEGIQKG